MGVTDNWYELSLLDGENTLELGSGDCYTTLWIYSKKALNQTLEAWMFMECELYLSSSKKIIDFHFSVKME